VTPPSLDVVLVIDVSGSLATGDVLAPALAVVERLLEAVPAETAWAVVAVGGTPQRVAGWTTDTEVVREALGRLEIGGASPLHDGVLLASDLLSLRPSAGRSVVLVVADGDDSGGAASLDAAVAALDGRSVWALALPTRDTDLERLTALVGGGGGEVVALEDEVAVTAMVQRLAEAPREVPVTTQAPVPYTVPATVPTTAVPSPPTSASSDSSALLVGGGAALFVGTSLALVALWPRPGAQATLGRVADRLSTGAERLLQLAGRRRRLGAVLDAAGVAVRPGELVMGVATFAVAIGLVIGALTSSPGLGLLSVAAVVLGVVVTVNLRLQRRRKAFAEQLPDLLGSLVAALRAGYALSQALDAVARNADSPGGDELGRVVTEVRLGRPMADALAGVAVRTASRDFAWVVTAMEIHREVGGDLGVIFDTVAETARERLRLAREVHALTAEGRVSAMVLTALPPLLVAALIAVSPDYLDPLRDGVGPMLMVGAGALMIVGWWWMRRLVRSGMSA